MILYNEYEECLKTIAALLAEKVRGQEFSSYAQDNLFQKSGMKYTTFFNLAKPVEIKERAFC